MAQQQAQQAQQAQQVQQHTYGNGLDYDTNWNRLMDRVFYSPLFDESERTQLMNHIEDKTLPFLESKNINTWEDPLHTNIYHLIVLLFGFMERLPTFLNRTDHFINHIYLEQGTITQQNLSSICEDDNLFQDFLRNRWVRGLQSNWIPAREPTREIMRNMVHNFDLEESFLVRIDQAKTIQQFMKILCQLFFAIHQSKQKQQKKVKLPPPPFDKFWGGGAGGGGAYPIR